MRRNRIDPTWHETGWFHSTDATGRDDFRDLEPVVPVRPRRRRAVKAIGFLVLAGVSAFAGWMAGTTSARGPIASWGTLGNAAQPSLSVASPLADELDAQRARLDQDALASPEVLWAMGPALAMADPERPEEHPDRAPAYDPAVLDPPPSNPDAIDELWRQATDL